MRRLIRAIVVLAVLAALAAGGAWAWRASHRVGTITRKDRPPAATLLEPAPNDWPWWRGVTGDNVSSSADVPVKWSPTENVRWKTDLPGEGHGSPVVRDNRIYLALADEAAATQSLACYDQANGQLVWSTVVHRGGFMPKHPKNSQASGTPICDGQKIYISFAHENAIWVTAVGLDGQIVWQIPAGPYVTVWGYGSSLALYEDTVLVVGDSRGSKLGRLEQKSFLTALDRQSGDIVWRIPRHDEHSFATPIVGRVAGREQLVITGAKWVISYNPKTGEELWRCEWGADRSASTVAFASDCVIASRINPAKETFCIRANGTGDVSATNVVWSSEEFAADVPSPLVHDGLLFVCTDDGFLVCADVADGKVRWRKRLGRNGASSSPLWAAGRVYIADEAGVTYVCSAKAKYELLSKNDLGEPIFATPAVSGNDLLIRSTKTLWCITGTTKTTKAD